MWSSQVCLWLGDELVNVVGSVWIWASWSLHSVILEVACYGSWQLKLGERKANEKCTVIDKGDITGRAVKSGNLQVWQPYRSKIPLAYNKGHSSRNKMHIVFQSEWKAAEPSPPGSRNTSVRMAFKHKNLKGCFRASGVPHYSINSHLEKTVYHIIPISDWNRENFIIT